jgi:hypothetical protein
MFAVKITTAFSADSFVTLSITVRPAEEFLSSFLIGSERSSVSIGSCNVCGRIICGCRGVNRGPFYSVRDMSIQMREGVVVRASESGTPAATVHAQNGQLSHLFYSISSVSYELADLH